MTVDRSFIRTKAMVILLSPDGTRHAVAKLPATAENPRGYHRLVGGGVELGEQSHEAAVREVREELGADLIDATLLGVVESIFTINGELGHEVVFVYAGRLNPADTIGPEGGMFADNGEPMPVEWRAVTGTDATDIPLYPEAARPLVAEAAALSR